MQPSQHSCVSGLTRFHQHRNFVHGSARATRHAGGPPHAPHVIRQSSNYRSRRTDELRRKYCGSVSSGRCLCRPHPQRRQTSRLAGGAVGEVRAGHQRRDRTDAQSRRTAIAACRRRRGYRVSLASAHGLLHLLTADMAHSGGAGRKHCAAAFRSKADLRLTPGRWHAYAKSSRDNGLDCGCSRVGSRTSM
jgi:hypothetical protein